MDKWDIITDKLAKSIHTYIYNPLILQMNPLSHMHNEGTKTPKYMVMTNTIWPTNGS